MTWAALKSDIQTFLGSDTRWTAAELMLYANWAIRAYSEYFFQVSSTGYTTDGTTKEWDLPSGYIGVERVEYDPSASGNLEFLEEIQIKPGTRFYNVSSNIPLMYHVEDDKLKLTSPPDAADTLTVFYQVRHTEIVDDSTTLTIPDRDLELIVLFVASKAAARVMIDQANLDRWKQRQVNAGSPVQNPLTPPHRQFEQEFWQRLFDRLPKGTVEIYRKGRGA